MADTNFTPLGIASQIIRNSECKKNTGCMPPITDMFSTAVPGKYLISTTILKMYVSHTENIISLLKHILLVA